MICITYAEVQPLMFESILSKQMKFMEFEKLLNDVGMVGCAGALCDLLTTTSMCQWNQATNTISTA